MPNDTRQWYKLIAAKADEPKVTTLHIYDVIGADLFFGGVDVNELVSEIEALDDDGELVVRINSPGGAAWDGMTLASAIMRHKGKTTTHVDGLAASAASLVALAGDNVVISKYGQMMLHNARGGVYSATAEELIAAGNTLKKLNGSMADYYADRAGGEAASWSRAMARETWYNADEAKEAGLATEVDESGKRDEVEASAAAAIAKAAAQFRYQGRQAAPAPGARVETEEAPVATSKTVLDALGLPEDATDEQVLAKINEGKGGDKPADKPEDKPADAPADKPEDQVDAGEISELAAAAAKYGLTLLDPGKVAAMQSDAALGRKAHETMEAQRIGAIVDGAVSSGKIPPARREHFVALAMKDEAGIVALFDTIPPETAVPMTELGHATPPAAQSDAEAAALKAAVDNWNF